MDFFEYATIALQFVNSDTLYVPLIVGCICFLLVFTFQAVGLFVIAGREGYAHRWMAFLPFFNTYYIGVCAQKNRVFKSVDTRTFSLIAAILEAVLFAGYVVYYVAVFKLFAADCFLFNVTENIYGQQFITYELGPVPVDLAWAAWCNTFLYDFILSWLDLIFMFLQVIILLSFFQTYSARRYFLFTIVSALFPVQGILVFILRNNRGKDYREFLRNEQIHQYRMYQQYSQQNPYQNQYEQDPYNDYSPEQNNSKPNAPEDPFSDFGGGNSSQH